MINVKSPTEDKQVFVESYIDAAIESLCADGYMVHLDSKYNLFYILGEATELESEDINNILFFALLNKEHDFSDELKSILKRCLTSFGEELYKIKMAA